MIALEIDSLLRLALALHDHEILDRRRYSRGCDFDVLCGTRMTLGILYPRRTTSKESFIVIKVKYA